MTPNSNQTLIALGGNSAFGSLPPEKVLKAALSRLSALGLVVERQSKTYRTAAFPPGSGPDFVNAAAVLTVPPQVTPEDLLALLHQVEAEFGRTRTQRWGARTLDLDLLAFGNAVLPDLQTHSHWRDLPLSVQQQTAPDRLILPHPRLQDRAFVLVPLADVASEWRHPVLGTTVQEMLERLPEADRRDVRLFP